MTTIPDRNCVRENDFVLYFYIRRLYPSPFFFFLLPNLFIYLPNLAFFLIHGPVPLIIVFFCVCVYCKYTNTKLLRLYNVSCIYVLMADHLLLDQSVCSSLRKVLSTAISSPQLPVVLCVGLRPPGLPPPSVIVCLLL